MREASEACGWSRLAVADIVPPVRRVREWTRAPLAVLSLTADESRARGRGEGGCRDAEEDRSRRWSEIRTTANLA